MGMLLIRILDHFTLALMGGGIEVLLLPTRFSATAEAMKEWAVERSWAVTCGPPVKIRFPLAVHLAAERQTWWRGEDISTLLMVSQRGPGLGLVSAEIPEFESITTMLGHGGLAAAAE